MRIGRNAATSHGSASEHTPPVQNRLLRAVPLVLARLLPNLESVRLERRESVFRAHEPMRLVCFPDTAVVSFVSRVEAGQTLEVGFAGRDGLTGVFPDVPFMPCDGIVQIPGTVHRIPVDVLRRELQDDESLRSIVGRFAQLALVRSVQMSACNMFHPVEQRCIRCLLTVHDLIDQIDIPLTHEQIASMLGVHRPTVTLVLGSLHRAGLVNEHRGHVAIGDRQRLEAASCECYRVMRGEQHRLLGY